MLLEAEASKVKRTTSRKVARTLIPKKEMKPAKRQKDTEWETGLCLGVTNRLAIAGMDCGKWVHEDCTNRDRCYVCHKCESN